MLIHISNLDRSVYVFSFSMCRIKKTKKHINDKCPHQANVDEKQHFVMIIVVFLSEIVNDELQYFIINKT